MSSIEIEKVEAIENWTNEQKLAGYMCSAP